MAAPYRSAYDASLTALLGGDWTRHAACAGKWMVMEDPDDTRGKAVCAGCPVVAECAEWVTSLHTYEQPDGVVAGMSARDRKRRRSRQRGLKAAATRREREAANA